MIYGGPKAAEKRARKTAEKPPHSQQRPSTKQSQYLESPPYTTNYNIQPFSLSSPSYINPSSSFFSSLYCTLPRSTMVKDEWVTAAMTDDMVVVDLLIRLKQSQDVSLSARPKSQPLPAPLLPLTWGLKQPRSKVKSASHCDDAASRRKEDDFTRFSPTTPLSWSGGASPSATADGYEESSRPTTLSQHAARFKVTPSEYTSSNSASTKRCKRKKTFAELKEEESSLLKERISLKREIVNLNATFRAQKAKNESLKRIKLDLGSTSQNNRISTCGEELRGQPHQRLAQESTDATEDVSHTEVAAADSNARRAESMGESFFLIPDLNAMPSEEDSYCDALHEMN